MKDKSYLKELIERRKRRLYLGSILFPIIIIFPCVIAFVAFYLQKYDAKEVIKYERREWLGKDDKIS